MRWSHIVIVAWSLGMGALAAGCSPESVPNAPTYEVDVKPILESRCIRCHGGGGELNDDKTHTGTFAGLAPSDGYFNRLDDQCPDGSTTGCSHGLLYYTMAETPNKADTLTGYIDSTMDSGRMPPPPSPALTSRQKEVLHNWLAKCVPPAGPGELGSCP